MPLHWRFHHGQPHAAKMTRRYVLGGWRRLRLGLAISMAISGMLVHCAEPWSPSLATLNLQHHDYLSTGGTVAHDPASSIRNKNRIKAAKLKHYHALSRLSMIGPGGGSTSGFLTPGQTRPVHGPTYLQRLSMGLRDSLKELGARNVSGVQLEEWACIIYESMSVPSRTFHRVDHVFDISEGADPVQTISAYFHDVIYYSIDGGLSEAQRDKLHDIIIEEGDGSVTLSDKDDFDPAISMVISTFGFEPGQTLNPFKGLNEFLSAVLAVRCLQDTLPMEHLFRIAACIEATIPFRGKDDNGNSVGQMLYHRLLKTRGKFTELEGLSDKDIVDIVQQALDLANRDVDNFAGDPATFLSNTWKLLPESNIAFRHTKVYRISFYADALQKMAGFFSYLDPTVIFDQFCGKPNNVEYKEMVSRAGRNLEIARKYMSAKMLAISVLGALAELTGGDAPLSLFVGDPYDPQYLSPRVEDHISRKLPTQRVGFLDETVLRILRDGRDADSSFDIRNSPLAAYLYGMIGDAGLEKSMPHTVYPMDMTRAKMLLQSLPNPVVYDVTTACAKVAVTRAEELQSVADNFEESEL